MTIMPDDYDRDRSRSRPTPRTCAEAPQAHIATSLPGRLATVTSLAGLGLLLAALITLNNYTWTVRGFCYTCALTGIPATAAGPLYIAAKLLRKVLPRQ